MLAVSHPGNGCKSVQAVASFPGTCAVHNCGDVSSGPEQAKCPGLSST